jgi:hypothetical protein
MILPGGYNREAELSTTRAGNGVHSGSRLRSLPETVRIDAGRTVRRRPWCGSAERPNGVMFLNTTAFMAGNRRGHFFEQPSPSQGIHLRIQRFSGCGELSRVPAGKYRKCPRPEKDHNGTPRCACCACATLNGNFRPASGRCRSDPRGSFGTVRTCSAFVSKCHSKPIGVRRKRQRLPSSLLIENASARVFCFGPHGLRAEVFPIKANDYSFK